MVSPMKYKPFALVIEDAIDIADIYKEILEIEGMQEEMIMDGAEAVERLAEVVPDLIILDMHLPHFSGLDILRFVRCEPHLKQTKVVVITANPLLAEAVEGMADRVFIKPVSTTQVCSISIE